ARDGQGDDGENAAPVMPTPHRPPPASGAPRRPSIRLRPPGRKSPARHVTRAPLSVTRRGLGLWRAHTEPRSFFLTQSRGERGGGPGRSAFRATPNVPRPDPRSYWMWFLPVGSLLIPRRRVPGEAGFTPRTPTRPERTTTSQDPGSRSAVSAEP